MKYDQYYQDLLDLDVGVVLKDEPLYKHTTFRVGGPAKLFVDFSWNNAISIIIAQLIYLAIAYLMCYLLYKKGVKKINVNGG